MASDFGGGRGGDLVPTRRSELMKQSPQYPVAPRAQPANLPDLLGERFTIPYTNGLVAQVEMEMRGRLGQTEEQILCQAAVRHVGMLLFSAAEFDTIAQSQPTERLMHLAEEIGEDYLEELGIELKQGFHRLAEDLRRYAGQPLMRNPNERESWKQRLGRKLLN